MTIKGKVIAHPNKIKALLLNFGIRSYGKWYPATNKIKEIRVNSVIIIFLIGSIKKSINKIVIQWPDGSKEEIDEYKGIKGLSSL